MTTLPDGSAAHALDLDEVEDDQEVQIGDGLRHEPVVSPDRKKRRTRPRTLSMRRQSKRELERLKQQYPDVAYDRPVTRGDCRNSEHAERPCPFVSCKHHLYLDVNPANGNIKLNFPDVEVWDMPETCSLDVADRGGITLEEVGAIMNLTRERIRQLEDLSLARLRSCREVAVLADYADGDGIYAVTFDDGSGARTPTEAIDAMGNGGFGFQGL